MKKHNKLVRDGIIERILGKGEKATWHIAEREEYARMLFQKLVEEAQELSAATKPEAQVEEMADVLEVIDAIRDLYPYAWEDVQQKKTMKAIRKGKFQKRIILEETD